MRTAKNKHIQTLEPAWSHCIDSIPYKEAVRDTIILWTLSITMTPLSAVDFPSPRMPVGQQCQHHSCLLGNSIHIIYHGAVHTSSPLRVDEHTEKQLCVRERRKACHYSAKVRNSTSSITYVSTISSLPRNNSTASNNGSSIQKARAVLYAIKQIWSSTWCDPRRCKCPPGDPYADGAATCLLVPSFGDRKRSQDERWCTLTCPTIGTSSLR